MVEKLLKKNMTIKGQGNKNYQKKHFTCYYYYYVKWFKLISYPFCVCEQGHGFSLTLYVVVSFNPQVKRGLKWNK